MAIFGHFWPKMVQKQQKPRKTEQKLPHHKGVMKTFANSKLTNVLPKSAEKGRIWSKNSEKQPKLAQNSEKQRNWPKTEHFAAKYQRTNENVCKFQSRKTDQCFAEISWKRSKNSQNWPKTAKNSEIGQKQNILLPNIKGLIKLCAYFRKNSFYDWALYGSKMSICGRFQSPISTKSRFLKFLLYRGPKIFCRAGSGPKMVRRNIQKQHAS